MSTIDRSIPLNAYAHVQKILEEAGGKDGIISRADAKTLVENLKKEGRGTEAMAAQSIFRMVDDFDSAPGARVTSYDLNQARDFVQNQLLQAHDVNGDGYAADELAKMAPTGRALVELGQVLEMERPRSRIAHRIPQQGMEHIADLINEASGNDPITSRKDADQLVKTLYAEGRGTEALAAAYFFRFIDHRDAAPGARITASDVERAVEYSGTHLLKNKDTNRNGYSSKEVEKFSTTAKAFLLVGQMIEAGIIVKGRGPALAENAPTPAQIEDAPNVDQLIQQSGGDMGQIGLQ